MKRRHILIAVGPTGSAGRDQPRQRLLDPHHAAPPLDLDLEQDPTVDGADAFVRGIRVSELLARLAQQRMLDLVEGLLGGWDR